MRLTAKEYFKRTGVVHKSNPRVVTNTKKYKSACGAKLKDDMSNFSLFWKDVNCPKCQETK